MPETRSAAPAKQRYSSLNVLFRWLVHEEIEVSPMTKVTKPKVEEKPVPMVSERAFGLVLDTCDSTFLGKSDGDPRLVWDSGICVSELVGIRVEDVSVDRGVVWVDGKTGERLVPFSLTTTHASIATSASEQGIV
jgi:site-specific recombinase XerC